MGLINERFTIRSKLSEAEIIKVLEENTESFRLIRSPFVYKHKYFHGKIEGNSFRIMRIIHYSNSFLPVLRGEIEGSFVKIRMGIMSLTKAFLGLLFAVLLFNIIPMFSGKSNFTINESPATQGEFIGITAIALTIFFVVLFLAFKLEARKQKKYLCDILNGEIEK